MTVAGSTSDRAKASRADVKYPSMARRNRAEVVIADEIGVYHCPQRVVRGAFLCGVDSLPKTFGVAPNDYWANPGGSVAVMLS